MKLAAEQRIEVILSAGVRIATERGLVHLTHDNVAAACKPETSSHTVRWYFNTKTELLRHVARHHTAPPEIKEEARRIGLA